MPAEASATVVKVTVGNSLGWLIKLGKSELRRNVVLDVSPEIKAADLQWLTDAREGTSILAQGKSILTPVAAPGGRYNGQDTSV